MSRDLEAQLKADERPDRNESRFTRSVVPYKRFKISGLRVVFTYLRDREDVLLRDIDRFTRKKLPEEARAAELGLKEVRSILLWLFTNFNGANSNG